MRQISSTSRPSDETNNAFRYRSDVDGLRALAIALVLIYHAGLGFSGGYIGVDVFFVISGFLITGIIHGKQEAGSFSVADFWVRRINRIAPAAFVMIVVVQVAGFLLLLPSDYRDLSWSAIAQQLFVSNVYFWRTTGYFDGPADLKPLLHTWSLAVEEQFYFAYPVLMVLLSRSSRRVSALVLASLSLLSLAVSEYGARAHPEAAFYLLPARAWELMLGGLICYLPSSQFLSWRVRSFGSVASLVSIVVVSMVLDREAVFPGVAALLPCLSAAVFIYANSSGATWSASLLAARPLVFLGKISYSLYLWHWPILAYVRYWIGFELPVPVGVLVVATSALAAYVSWRFVEQPFRRGSTQSFSGRNVVALYMSSIVGVVLLSVIVIGLEGAKFRFSDSVLVYDAARDGRVLEEYGSGVETARSGRLPNVGLDHVAGKSVDFVVWGDSHARMIAAEVDRLAVMHGLRGVVAARSATPPIMDLGNESSDEWNRLILKFIIDNRVRNVLLVARWQVGFVDGKKSRVDYGMLKTVRLLHLAGVRVVVMHQVPTQAMDYRSQVALSALMRWRFPMGVSVEEYRREDQDVAAAFKRLQAMGVGVISVEEHCFSSEGRSPLADDKGGFYWDDDHLSPHGVRVLLSECIDSFLEEIDGTEK